jgi:hypothetical protein
MEQELWHWFTEAIPFALSGELWSRIKSTLGPVSGFLEHPAVRTVGLLLIVFLTIRAIAAIYGGEIQNGKYGPLGLRPHSAQALGEKDIRLPRALIPMGLDGVHAVCEIFYAYNDRRGRRVEQRLFVIHDARINVVPSPLPRVVSAIYGLEATDAIRALHSEDVVFPTSELEAEPQGAEPTSSSVGDYLAKHRIIETWTEDDAALLISVHQKVLKRIADEREVFITGAAEKLREAREGNWWSRRRARNLARKRPNVIGSFYVRFKLSRNPWFILTRHPDRDLKMTAWLTVLTSVFAMIMEFWPLRLGEGEHAGMSQSENGQAARPRPSPRTPAQ